MSERDQRSKLALEAAHARGFGHRQYFDCNVCAMLGIERLVHDAGAAPADAPHQAQAFVRKG